MVYQALAEKEESQQEPQARSGSGQWAWNRSRNEHAKNGSHKSALAGYVEWAGGIGKAIEILQVVQGAKVPF